MKDKDTLNESSLKKRDALLIKKQQTQDKVNEYLELPQNKDSSKKVSFMEQIVSGLKRTVSKRKKQ